MITDAKTTINPRTVFGGVSVVLVADEINLSYFRALWTRQANILHPEELSGQCVILPEAIQIPTTQFHLLVVPQRLQMSFAEMDDRVVQEPLNRVLGGILRDLPPIPFRGLGFNFDFFVGPNESERFLEWSKELFASKGALTICADAAEHPRFGSYVSLDFEGMRLKIDIKPIKGAVGIPTLIHKLQSAPEWMHFNFNYHVDLNPETSAQTTLGLLAKWNMIAMKTRSVIAQIEG
jgi:hypothetical protein